MRGCSTCCCRAAVPCAGSPAPRSADVAVAPSSGSRRLSAGVAVRLAPGPSVAARSAPAGDSDSRQHDRRSSTRRAVVRSSARGKSEGAVISRASPRSSSPRRCRDPRPRTPSPSSPARPTACSPAVTLHRSDWRGSWGAFGASRSNRCSSGHGTFRGSAGCRSSSGAATSRVRSRSRWHRPRGSS